jgi:signal transduction histidine kinase
MGVDQLRMFTIIIEALFHRNNNCASAASTLAQITKNTLQTQQEQLGTIDLVIGRETVGSYYISRPIQLTSPNDGSAQTIGCVILTMPITSLTGLLYQANQSIILAGAGVALVARVVSYLLVSRFIRPIESDVNELRRQDQLRRDLVANIAHDLATGGSGLGLAIVKAIITAHRGQVWAESIPGKGTRVLFTLPPVLPIVPTTPQGQKQLLTGPLQQQAR